MKSTDHDEAFAREEVLEELFSHATLRERPPADTERAIRETLHGQWKIMARSRNRRRGLALAAAASVALVVVVAGFLFNGHTGPQAGLDAASVERLRGRVSLHLEHDGPVIPLEPGAALSTAQAVSTAHGAGLALRWHNGIAVRLDQNSRVFFTSQQNMELVAGRVYVDTSGVEDDAQALWLSTPAGPVQHVGTRYMVAVHLGATSVSVREGQVRVGSDRVLASAGEKLRVNASGQQRTESIAVYGDDWQWADTLAEPVSSAGRSVAELLAWIGDETGRSVQYDSPRAERLAAETRLHGDIALEPMQTLELITKSTDLVAEVLEGTIVVEAVPVR
jgi:ferric-dicitrate binding protein FerR (iron transport regulator)